MSMCGSLCVCNPQKTPFAIMGLSELSLIYRFFCPLKPGTQVLISFLFFKYVRKTQQSQSNHLFIIWQGCSSHLSPISSSLSSIYLIFRGHIGLRQSKNTTLTFSKVSGGKPVEETLFTVPGNNLQVNQRCNWLSLLLRNTTMSPFRLHLAANASLLDFSLLFSYDMAQYSC